MSEFRFVLKCFVLTALLVMLLQIKIGGVSLEQRALHWVRHSTVSHYVQGVAAGGVMAAKKAGVMLKKSMSSTMESFQEGAAEKAIR